MRRSFKVVVRASDSGIPFRRMSETILTFDLANVNDKIPVLEKTDCSGYLSREAPERTSIVVITAIDFDSDMVSYEITSGNDDRCFDIERNTGLIFLNCSLLNSQEIERTVTVMASDGRFTSETASVHITFVNNKKNVQLSNSDANIQCKSTNISQEFAKQVQTMRENNAPVTEILQTLQDETVNIHSPVFGFDTGHTMEISEAAAIGQLVMAVTADDEDHGYSGRVSYSILSGDLHDQFKIGHESGKITVASGLDREIIPKYSLAVLAVDQANEGLQKSATASIEIVLTDENDNGPIFEEGTSEVHVSESYRVNATIAQVIARDADLGDNGKVVYSIATTMNKFSIGADNGIVKVNMQLDREEKATYLLPIRASDLGSPPKSSTTTMTIHLDDENDNAPRFVPDRYDIKIREDLPVGTLVTIIKAEDLDAGRNGRISYSLSYGTEDKFDIDEDTGVIRIIERLDFENQQIYNISAVAEDGGGLMSACFVNIEIMDVNEDLKPPVFERFYEDAYVKENLPVGAFIKQVLIQDDEEVSRHITYTIRDGCGLGRFTIDNNGKILLKLKKILKL